MAELETFVDQLAAASAEAKQVLGEVRSELREVRRERKALASDLEAARAAVADVVRAEISDEVRRHMDDLVPKIKESQEAAMAKATRRIEEIYNLALTGNKQGRSADGFDLRNLGRDRG